MVSVKKNSPTPGFMIRKTLSLSIILGIVFAPLHGAEVYAFSVLPITAKSAILIDHSTQRIVYAKTPHLKRAPASTTKILTSIVAVQNMDLNRVVTIPAFAEKMPPSKIYLKTGEKYRIKDLIRALLITSANDAAEALSFIGGGGSRAHFADLMNRKARSLGCSRSHFVNASGLPAKNQYSTAYDMALIMKEAQRYPFLVETMGTRTMQIQSRAGRKIFLKNHNKMLWQNSRAVVGKTGWTRTAKYCFVGQINFNGRKVFVSMLGSLRLWKDLKTLVDYPFGLALLKRYPNHTKGTGREGRMKIQLALKRAGFDPGQIDGRFGRKTLRALKKFQKAKGLRGDAIVGSRTRNQLQRFTQ